MMQGLVLGSGSRYKQELLARLKLPFTSIEPDIDESRNGDEAPAALAQRLAASKANAVCNRLRKGADSPDCLLIGADQVAAAGDMLLHKPQTMDRACRQLSLISGRKLTFYTALHMLSLATERSFTALDKTTVAVRTLTTEEIQRYVACDQPLDCAGSFKVESLGISLFDRVTTDDPTALIGLPLIAVTRGLRAFGLAVP